MPGDLCRRIPARYIAILCLPVHSLTKPTPPYHIHLQGEYGRLMKLHNKEPIPCCHRCEPLLAGWMAGEFTKGWWSPNNHPLLHNAHAHPHALLPLPCHNPCCTAVGDCSQTSRQGLHREVENGKKMDRCTCGMWAGYLGALGVTEQVVGDAGSR